MLVDRSHFPSGVLFLTIACAGVYGGEPVKSEPPTFSYTPFDSSIAYFGDYLIGFKR